MYCEQTKAGMKTCIILKFNQNEIICSNYQQMIVMLANCRLVNEGTNPIMQDNWPGIDERQCWWTTCFSVSRWATVLWTARRLLRRVFSEGSSPPITFNVSSVGWLVFLVIILVETSAVTLFRSRTDPEIENIYKGSNIHNHTFQHVPC